MLGSNRSRRICLHCAYVHFRTLFHMYISSRKYYIYEKSLVILFHIVVFTHSKVKSSFGSQRITSHSRFLFNSILNPILNDQNFMPTFLLLLGLLLFLIGLLSFFWTRRKIYLKNLRSRQYFLNEHCSLNLPFQISIAMVIARTQPYSLQPSYGYFESPGHPALLLGSQLTMIFPPHLPHR